jgi:hypothetical protein
MVASRKSLIPNGSAELNQRPGVKPSELMLGLASLHAKGQQVCDRYRIVPALEYVLRYNEGSVGATWFRRGLQSSAGHTEGWLPRKYTQKKLNCKR